MNQLQQNILKLNTRKDGCNICSSWTAFNGCKHHHPQDYDKNKPIIDAIVAAVHGNNREIIETSDFYAGINAALLVLRQNGLIKNKIQ
jgi:hypothetical protein